MQDFLAPAALPLIAPMEGPPPVPAGVPSQLNRRAKAAIIVRYLLQNGADLPLEALPDNLQADLTQQMGKLRLVDRATLDSVIEEFRAELEAAGLAFPNGLAGAISALDGKINPRTAARLRKEAGVRQSGDPWERLRELPNDELAAIAQSESIEVAAVLLSKLPTAKAAEMLSLLPGPLSRRIAYAVSLTESVTPDAVDRIGLSLAAQLDLKPLLAFEKGPGERLGEILNESPASSRLDVLTGLDETDQEFAEDVRRNIFTFALIPQRINPRDIPAIVRAVNPQVFVTALAGATSEEDAPAREFILGNMSGRMADNMRDEIGDRGKVKSKDAEAAFSEVVKSIRELIRAGEIEMVSADDSEEEE